MKTPISTPTTRASLVATAAHNTRWFASLIAGTTVLSTAFATDWVGDTSGDWNNNLNWQGDAGNSGNAVVNTVGGGNPPFTALISANTTQPVVDIFVGINPGQTGRLDHTAGIAATGGGNWMEVGTNGGTGTYNLTGTGSLNVGGRLYVGGSDGGGRQAAGSIGTVTVNTTGTLAMPSDLVVGEFDGTGTFNLQSGTVTTGGWNFCGRRAGSEGYMNISGGTLTNSGRFYIGENATGVVNQTGGTMTNGGEVRIGQGAGGNATLNLSAGTFSANGWCLIGREGSNGTLNLSGTGTFIKNNGDPFAIGNDPGVGSGTINQTGGTLTTASGSTMRIGGHADSNGTWTISAGTATIGGEIQIGADGNGTLTMNGGSINAPGNVRVGAVSTATFNLNAGTLTTGKISGGGGVDTTTFNGTQIVVSTPINPFIETLDNATIAAGGLLVNTNGFNATSTQPFSGPGGVIKTGTGILSLSGPSSNSGANSVVAGKLAVSTAATGSGNFSVANGAALGVSQANFDEVLNVPNVTFGTAPGHATSLDLNFGNLSGNSANAPLNVTGTLTLNGNVTVNITDAFPATGIIPLVSYSGAKGGTGSFVFGSLPNGVQTTPAAPASIIDNPNYFGPGLGLVYINVTSVSLPLWNGTVNSKWDTTTANWIDQVTSLGSLYANPAPVLFDDQASGPGGTSVTLDVSVAPSSVTFDNSSAVYSLSGTGKITGNTGLNKLGTAALSISTANEYLGATVIQGGTLSVPSLPNGGSAGPIGMSSASSANLELAGGVLGYTGAATATDRGFTISAAGGGVNTANDLTFSGAVASTGGNLIKSGAGNLVLSNAANVIGISGQVSQVVGGTLTFNGVGATNSIPGELWIGSTPNVAGHLLVNGGSLNVGSWIALGRGNGDSGTVSSLTATNATIQCVNFSTGFNNGLPNDSDQTVTLTNSTFTNNGNTLLAESEKSLTTLVIEGTSTYNSNGRFQIALGLDTVCNVTVKDSGSFNKTGGWLSIGNGSNGVGTLTVQDNGTFAADGDFNVSDVDTSTGTINIKDSAVVTSTGTFFLGKNGGTTGTANLNGGTLRVIRVRGGAGTGTFNFNGGVLQALPGADGNFMSLLTGANVLAGGGTIDTNGVNVTVAQSLGDGGGGGGLTKIGAGTLTLNTFNSYTGATTVNAGTLAGSGSVAGPLVVASGATIAPGNTVGSFLADSAVISGTYACELNGANNDVLDVVGALNLSSATDVLNITTPGAGATLPVYVIASYATRTGTFNSVTGTLPGTYTIDYNYNGGTQIALVRPPTPFETWINTFYTGETDPAIIGTGADPDGDGQPNGLEFALGGNPASGSNNAKVYHLEEDSNDAGAQKELLMTIAVRNGGDGVGLNPVFLPATGGSPTATQDGATYTIQGGNTLAFGGTVSVVATVTTGLPPAPAGYEYRTFSLDGSNGLSGKGFLRVNVTP